MNGPLIMATVVRQVAGRVAGLLKGTTGCARNTTGCLSLGQQYCTAPPQVSVNTDSDGIAQLRMNKKPVNSLNLEYLTELVNAIEKLHMDRQVKGLILSSDVPRIFCAGLDITEMYNPEEGRLREFWRSFQELWRVLFSSRLPVVAAIDGHAVAGGCMIALTTDVRVMSEGKHAIGLNETLLGLIAPFWLADTYERTVGWRQCERLLQLGVLCSPSEAEHVGLVDHVVPAADVYTTAYQHVKRWMAIPEHARHLTKLQCRQPLLDKFTLNREQNIDDFCNAVFNDAAQKSLGEYLASLKTKKK